MAEEVEGIHLPVDVEADPALFSKIKDEEELAERAFSGLTKAARAYNTELAQRPSRPAPTQQLSAGPEQLQQIAQQLGQLGTQAEDAMQNAQSVMVLSKLIGLPTSQFIPMVGQMATGGGMNAQGIDLSLLRTLPTEQKL
jgi:hypothetical protein